MSRELWIDSELDLADALERKYYDALLRYVSYNQQNLKSKWANSDHIEIKKSIRYGMSLFEFFEEYLEKCERERTIFRLGSLMGTIENLDDLLYEEDQAQWSEINYKEQVKSVKHLDEIILILEVHGIMSHSEICKSLGLKESTLSEIMKKVSRTNLVSFSKHGKYKMYRLTDQGRYLGKQLRKKDYKKLEKDEVLKQLKYYLDSEKNTEFFESVKEIVGQRKGNLDIELPVGTNLEIYHKSSGKQWIDKYTLKMQILDCEKNDNRNKKFYAEKYSINMLDNISNY